MQHKKRGRPKLRDKKVYSSNEHNYKILYGTIQTPSISANNSNNRSIVPNIQAPPFKGKLPNTVKRPPAISFIHEPIESFQSLQDTNNQQDIPSIHLAYDYKTSNMLLDALPTTQLASILLPPQQQQQQQQHHTIFDYSNITNPILLNNGNNNTISNFETKNDSIVDENLTIIMSMEVCCAKVSNDTIKCWGYYPQELAHRSFYDFISPKDSDRLARLHRLLLDNAMDTIKHTASTTTTTATPPLPPTERTTSLLFSNTDQTVLSVIANGSRSFSDSIHIKKRCGEYELYKVVVYIGGGLGADLYDITSFSKQYIVAQFRKHEYEVVPPSVTSSVLSLDELSNNTESCYQNIEPIAVFSPMSPLSPSSPNIAYSHAGTTVTAAATATNNNNYTKLDMFKNYNSGRSLFSHTRKDHKPLSATAKFSQMSIIPPCSPPKFNIAPITTQHPLHGSSGNSTKHYNSSFLSRFPPSASSSTAGPSSSVAVPVSSLRLRTTDRPTVTHPTQQYFLQTSSSSLNAAASAAANSNKARRSISGPTTSESPATSNQKMEMSIRSLLC